MRINAHDSARRVGSPRFRVVKFSTYFPDRIPEHGSPQRRNRSGIRRPRPGVQLLRLLELLPMLRLLRRQRRVLSYLRRQRVGPGLPALAATRFSRQGVPY
jgi:hypothetical protein